MKMYRDQYKKCKKNENLIEIDASKLQAKIISSPLSGINKFIDVVTILVCLKYKCICHSGACKEERLKIEE